MEVANNNNTKKKINKTICNKAKKACFHCKKGHKKCENVRPCNNCKRLNLKCYDLRKKTPEEVLRDLNNRRNGTISTVNIPNKNILCPSNQMMRMNTNNTSNNNRMIPTNTMKVSDLSNDNNFTLNPQNYQCFYTEFIPIDYDSIDDSHEEEKEIANEHIMNNDDILLRKYSLIFPQISPLILPKLGTRSGNLFWSVSWPDNLKDNEYHANNMILEDISEQFASTFGRTRNQMLHTNCKEFSISFTDNCLANYSKNLVGLCKEYVNFFKLRSFAKHHTGLIIMIECLCAVFKGTNGKPSFMFGYVKDSCVVDCISTESLHHHFELID